MSTVVSTLEGVQVPPQTIQKWQEIVDVLAEILRIPAALIMRVQRPNIKVFVSSESKGNPYEPDELASLNTGLYCETVMKTRALLLVPDALVDQDWKTNPDIKLGMISYMGLPVAWPNGHIFGTICVLDSKLNEYNELYRKLLSQFRDVLQADLKSLQVQNALELKVLENKRVEELQRALLAELDHRVKNVLATVSAIASHTRDASSSMDDFVTALDTRIRSMAATHELLSHSRWQGVPMAELAHRELAPYTLDNNTCIEGPEVILRAEAAQTTASVLHELTTNAAKYGALSKPDGRVSVRWHCAPDDETTGALVIEWIETGGPPVGVPSPSGFGRRVITELVRHELGGAARLEFSPEGVRCWLNIPGTWLAPVTNRSEP